MSEKDLAKWTAEMQTIGEKILQNYTNFKKDSTTRKTPIYKQEKLTSLENDWKAFTRLDAKVSDGDDRVSPGYVKMKTEVEAAYAKYRAALMLLSDNEGNDESQNQNSTAAEIAKRINSQKVRFEKISEVIEQLKNKIDGREEMSKVFLNLKIKNISNYWERILIANEELGSFGTPLPQKYSDEIRRFEEDVEEIIVFLQEQLEGVTNQKNNDIKLPRIVIPKFGGEYSEWVQFRDLFQSVVLDNNNLSDAQRMQFLKTSIEGEAEKLISDLTISNVNFNSAWERLTHRYENKRVIVAQYLTKIVTQPRFKSDSTDSKQIKRMLDTTDQILMALENLKRPVKEWDDWVVLTLAHKLNDEIRREWEKKIGDSVEPPKWETLKKFLEEEFRIAEGVEAGTKKKNPKPVANLSVNQIAIEQKKVNSGNCVICKKQHTMFNCPNFKKMKPEERKALARKEKLCFKCLSRHEGALSCERENPCKKCTLQNHNTWLHKTVSKDPATTDSQKGRVSATVLVEQLNEADQKNVVASLARSTKNQTLLATAVITIYSNNGEAILFRALLDSGSQGSFIRKSAIELLQMLPRPSQATITPIGGDTKKAPLKVSVKILPRFSSTFELEVECYVLNKVTRTLPDENLHIHTWKHLKELTLADPQFHRVGPIDILLGMEVMSELLDDGFIKGEVGQPIAQQTALGWIVSGKIDRTHPSKEIVCLNTTTETESVDLSRFWELEELNPKRMLTPDEERCETLFLNTVRRNPDGSFTVNIPFKDGENGPEGLGNSKSTCIARFVQLEKKFARDNDLKQEYVRVMKEYLDLGHMRLVTKESPKTKKYYIPHHAVLKPESLTTKMRVVFDASSKTTTGRSLNDTMYVGAKQQHDLLDILINWRKHRIVFKADVAKMYRQIELSVEDQRYHTIVWRDDQTKPMQEYQMTTVTFGTAAAPFLATRTLKQLAEENNEKYPKAATVIKNDFYVDDLISGSETIEAAIETKNEVITVLNDGKFSLRKWTSNSAQLLNSLPAELTEQSLQKFDQNNTTKALGIQWNPTTDQFSFEINWVTENPIITKRILLAEASKLFDPLGWLAPVIISAKLLMQQVWLTKIDWDQEVPDDIKEKWSQMRIELPQLSSIRVNRWIGYLTKHNVQVLGFCDASEKGYAAVVYTRVETDKEVRIQMIASKTRVAPIRLKLTLPRLELCGAVLLSNLMTRVTESLKIENVRSYAWSDSTATLGWLKGEPSRWKTFIANRVAEATSNQIQEWNYVPSAENPADCASRGIMPHELQNHDLWWEGPSWLKNHPDTWIRTDIADNNAEQRDVVAQVATMETSQLPQTSSWTKLLRIIAYCLRWKKENRCSTRIILSEMTRAETRIFKICQEESFPVELDKLRRERPIPRGSKLIALDPFLDTNGIIRVGGRLENASISYDNKHPIILAQKHQVSQLLVQQIHKETLHGGPQLMGNMLRKRFWVLQSKRLLNNEYKKCVICKRYKGQPQTQVMGQLPKERVTLGRAFQFSGVDYAGPIQVKSSKLRNAKMQKGYIAIFICLGTKAIHLELVSDATQAAFQATFNRFIARRGLPQRMHSDNGTCFTGAWNKIQQEQKEFFKEKNEGIAAIAANKGIDWHFIPPGAPTFGGLWERGVRSIKEHLRKQVKNANLTFEELSTVLCQVEATVNSRPLGPLTADCENLNALTPGHFLIGDALLTRPSMLMADNAYNRTDRWRYLQLLHQHFWNRWHTEYLHQQQQRQKWRDRGENLKKGELVLVKEDNLPPRVWLMGRIIEVHPGQDGFVRVVTLQTKNGELKRPITKIVPLVGNEEEDTPINDDASVEEIESSEDEAEDSGINAKKASGKETKSSDAKKASLPATRVLRPRLVNGVMLMLGIIFLLGGGWAAPVTNEGEEPLKMTVFEHQSGLFYENMGTVEITRSDWHIYIRFDLQKYKYEQKVLSNMVTEIRNACDKMRTSEVKQKCVSISSALQYSSAEMQKLNILLRANGHMTETKENSRHIRAAPLNIVGWLGHELFGVMAADQADQIEDQMDLVDQNENHLLNLLKNQSNIVDQTIAIMRTTQQEIDENYASIQANLDRMDNETNEVRYDAQIIETALYVSILMGQFEEKQKGLLEMVNDVHQGHVSSHIFSPQQFEDQLNMMKSNLPAEIKLPGKRSSDVRTLYRLLTGKVRVTENNILMDITMPLVSATSYQLLHVVPYPIEHNGMHVSVTTESEYLVINLKRDKFYQMNENQLNSCIQPDGAWFICKMKQPMYSMLANQSQCEREILTQGTDIQGQCHFNLTTKQELTIPLKQKNQWIVVLHKTHTVNTICEEISKTTTLQAGVGVLNINPGCEVTLSTMTLIAEANKASEGQLDINPPLNLKDTVIQDERQGRNQWVNSTINHYEQFERLHEQIHELHNRSTLTPIHYTHMGITSGAVIILIGLVGIIWANRDRIKRTVRKTNATENETANPHKTGTQNNAINDDVDDSKHRSTIAPIATHRVSTAHWHEGEDVQLRKNIFESFRA